MLVTTRLAARLVNPTALENLWYTILGCASGSIAESTTPFLLSIVQLPQNQV